MDLVLRWLRIRELVQALDDTFIHTLAQGLHQRDGIWRDLL